MSYELTAKKKKFNHDAIEDIALRDAKELQDTIRDTGLKPWDFARIDVSKFINVRMPEEYFMKLDYVSKKHRLSKNKICLEAAIAQIDRMLAE